jgi:hypothetical protein
MQQSTPTKANAEDFKAPADLCKVCKCLADVKDEKGVHMHSQRNRKVNLPPKDPLPCCCYYVTSHIRCTRHIHSKAERRIFLDMGKRVGNERKKRGPNKKKKIEDSDEEDDEEEKPSAECSSVSLSPDKPSVL